MQFPKITVVVNKIKKSILYPAVAVKSQRCDASVWPGGDILTFVSSLGNSNKEEHYSFLFLPLLHSWGGGNIYIKLREWTQADCRCLCLLPLPREVKLLVKLFHFPYFLSLCLHLSYRDTDDPEVSLQLQCQLHWPPHLSVHALTTEDGAGTPEPPAG